MKISVAHVANGQVASKGDPMFLLAGGENFSFASLLDLDGGEPDTAHQFKGNRTKQDNSSKDKEGDGDQRSALSDSKQSGTSIPLGLQNLPCVNAQSWQFDACDVGTRGNGVKVSLSSLTAEPAHDTIASRTQPQGANAGTVDAQTSGNGQVVEKSAEKLSPFFNLNVVAQRSGTGQAVDTNSEKLPPFHNLNVVELNGHSEGIVVGNQDSSGKGAIAQPDDIAVASAAAPCSALDLGAGEQLASLAANGIPTPERAVNSTPTGTSVVQSSVIAANHELKTDDKSQGAAPGAADRADDLAGERGAGQAKLAASLQEAVEAVSRSSAGGSSQGNGSDTHHGPSDAKDTLDDSRLTAQQTLQSSSPGIPGTGPAPGHSVSTNSARVDSALESPHNTQFKAMTLPGNADVSAARLLGSAMRSDLRVGVQTEAFGRVTIQTSAQGGQLSAQLSLENAKDSAALAAHLPGVEQKIVQQHGLNASVRLVGFNAGAGAGSMGREQSGSSQRNTNAFMLRPDRVASDASNEGRGAEGTLLGSRYLVSSRLDVTV